MKSKWVTLGKLGMWVACAAVSFFCGGCATPTLVRETAPHNWSPDSGVDRVLTGLVGGQPETLVVFRQTTQIDNAPRERVAGWNLKTTPDQLVTGRLTVKRLTNGWEQVQSLPVFRAHPLDLPTAFPPSSFVVVGQDLKSFSIYQDFEPTPLHQLPFTHQPCRKWDRALALPIAITADAVLVAAIAGLVCLGGLSGASY